ncbi:MAG: tRNA 2-thiouridine(34) synthase MnmA [Lachnospiraceae bacterium]|nr:tRNA 2-thiouridine(34) synthase MnmA [Lachnospiraceae bacterium]
MTKVIVGMSGGVDSAVTAYLLKIAGYDVVGLTLRTFVFSDGADSRCCEIDDAKQVADTLGIPYYVKNCMSEFKNTVVRPFVNDYISGVTPNPCVLCNRSVKWDKMLEFAKMMQADLIATGHYASVVQLENGRYTVRKGVHGQKDQAYMLYRLMQGQLAKTLMPLGRLTKQEVRDIAKKASIPVAEKGDSQEICFVPDDDYAGFIEENAETELPGEGMFVDEEGNVLGRHRGIIHYTVGQRKGLGIALGYPAYVKEINTEKNEVVIASEDALYSKEIFCRDLNFLSIPGLKAGEKLCCKVKVRYHHKEQEAEIEMTDQDKIRVTFEDPVRAAAPGQSAVFYDDEGNVIGGGIIE